MVVIHHSPHFQFLADLSSEDRVISAATIFSQTERKELYDLRVKTLIEKLESERKSRETTSANTDEPSNASVSGKRKMKSSNASQKRLRKLPEPDFRIQGS